MAKLVALEGIDGSGKGTQAARLTETLRRTGRRVTLLSFPRYEHTTFGKRIGEFLDGRFGSLESVSPLFAALLYAGDRFESKPVLVSALSHSDVVILDRYVASNIAHQCAKLEGAARDELREWIEHLEFGLYDLPRPHLTLLFDLPAAAARVLISKKSPRSYTDKPADLQEANQEYLERVRGVYHSLAEHDATWKRIDVMANSAFRTIDEIGRDAFSAVDSLFDAGRKDPNAN